MTPRKTPELEAKALARALEKKRHTLVLAESCTGGMVSALLTQIPGISRRLSGSFVCYQQTLLELAPAYAKPVNDRSDKLAHPREFALAYLEGFDVWFRHIQGHYRDHRRAFDALFKHMPPDPEGNFSYRWECVLRRLNEADPAELVRAIRSRIAVLP